MPPNRKHHPGLERKPSWQASAQEKRRRQWRSFWLSIIVVLLFFLAAAAILEFWKGWRQAIWDGKRTFYFAIQAGETSWLVKLDKDPKEAIAVEIPPDMILSVAKGFGEYQAKSIYKLGELEKSSGSDLLKDSLTLSFGLPVEGVIRFSKPLKQQFSLKFLLLKTVIGLGKTNLTKWDSLRLFLLSQSLRGDQIEIFSFTEIPGVTAQVRPDGLKVWVIEPERLDIWLRQRLVNNELVNETYTWEVINATDHSGFAAQVARLLRNTGLQVVKMSEGEASESQLLVANSINSSGLEFFSHFLDIPIKRGRTDSSQADVKLILGDSFWRRCCSH